MSQSYLPSNRPRNEAIISARCRDPDQIKPCAVVVAGDEDTAAVCQVVNLAPAGEGTIVHLRLLSGLVDDHQQLVERAS